MIRLVLFDAVATLIKPRRPIATQYSEIFGPFFVLKEEDIKSSFKTALRGLQDKKPVYSHVEGVQGWWGEVIRQTALGAGADPIVVDESLPVIVPQLMARFSSKEGYELYDDVLPALRELQRMKIQAGVTSNADSRVRAALESLEILHLLKPCILSEEEGCAKPSSEIWTRSIAKSGIQTVRPREVVHIGDELKCDYYGATAAGLHALLLRRPGLLGAEEWKTPNEDLSGIPIVSHLGDVVTWILKERGSYA